MEFQAWVLIMTLFIFIFLIDDMFIDLVYFFKSLGPRPIDMRYLTDCSNQKNLAIMIANWKEEDVIEQMVKGNRENIPSNKVHFFLGVYPNDYATKEKAIKLSHELEGVHVVINRMNGPTYKGQMLNEIVHYIFAHEDEWNLSFDGFVLHDSEDIIDPFAPFQYGLGLNQADFIQTPVLSLPLHWSELVGGTYMDEFSEIHTKDLLVRQYLGAAIPSAGVGTCLSRKLVITMLNKQNESLFLPNSLTEDYILGLTCAQLGFRSTFLCLYPQHKSSRNIIATKEYFPQQTRQSIKQKTRWTTGIAFQGQEGLGWFGNLWQRYFLWRDRKAPMSALLGLNSFIALLFFAYKPDLFASLGPLTKGLLTFNLGGTLFRVGVRVHCTHTANGPMQAILSLFRYPVGIIINSCAGLRAAYQYRISKIRGTQIKWSKTQHKVPQDFATVVANRNPNPQSPFTIQQNTISTLESKEITT